jgi:undecaprenyl diphosphate synthase
MDALSNIGIGPKRMPYQKLATPMAAQRVASSAIPMMSNKSNRGRTGVYGSDRRRVATSGAPGTDSWRVPPTTATFPLLGAFGLQGTFVRLRSCFPRACAASIGMVGSTRRAKAAMGKVIEKAADEDFGMLANDPAHPLRDIAGERIPKHIAVIMDGNGRWAVRRGEERVRGHRQGAEAVEAIVRECAKLNKHRGAPQYLTLYSFSQENWKRPANEVNALMQMYMEFLRQQRKRMNDNNLRFKQIGRLDNLPAPLLAEVQETVALTRSNTGLTLVLAMNYGSRAEIIDAVRAIAGKVRRGEMRETEIDEQAISDHLYTSGSPDPDLLIRTAGEMRISNYLLWQISYAELYVSDTLWPDYTIADLHAAIRAFSMRNRRFGALDQTDTRR